MYYISISENDSNKMIYYCRNCGSTDENTMNDNICVLKTYLQKGEQTFNHIVNKYTKFDPTLPRIYNVKCPNINCVSNNDEKIKPEVIYMRYDDTNMKYIYICTLCDTNWKTNDK
jgi:aspartate carbamoyltransferase regulatory subunit